MDLPIGSYPAYIPLNTDVSFAGLVPGYVGLYQVNFTVPGMAAQTHQCQEVLETNARLSIAFILT